MGMKCDCVVIDPLFVVVPIVWESCVLSCAT